MKKVFLNLLILWLVLLSGCRPWPFAPALKFTGTLETTEHNVGARVAGRVAEVFVKEGEKVKRGQLLATLDRFEQAQKDYARAQKIFAKGGLSEQALEQAQWTLDDQQILAPVDGEVLLKVHESGEVVSAGATVAVIADLSRQWVKIFVPEGQINRLRMGQKAWVRMDGLRDAKSAHVTFIAVQAEFTPRNVQTPEERVTQTFGVKVSLEDPGTLRPGVAADVTFE